MVTRLDQNTQSQLLKLQDSKQVPHITKSSQSLTSNELEQKDEDRLLNELWALIFSNLDKLGNVRLTCKKFEAIIWDDMHLGKNLFKNAFGCVLQSKQQTQKELFRNLLFNTEQCLFAQVSSAFFYDNGVLFHPSIAATLPHQISIQNPPILLLSENLLFVCKSTDTTVRQLWDISQTPPGLISSHLIPRDLNHLLLLGCLCSGSFLMSQTEILAPISGAECIIMNFDTLDSRTLFKMTSLSSISFVDVKRNPTSQFAALTFENGFCEIWDLSRCQKTIDFQFDQPANAVCLDIENGRLAAGFNDGTVQIWDIVTLSNAEKKPLRSKKIFNSPVKLLCIQGNILAAVSDGGLENDDEIKIMSTHHLKQVDSIKIKMILRLCFQGTKLVVIHGSPLEIKHFDFSMSDEEFFQKQGLDPLIKFEETTRKKCMLILKRFSLMPDNARFQIIKRCPKGLRLENIEHDCVNNVQILLEAIKLYYKERNESLQ